MISGLAKRLKTARTNAGLSRKEAADIIGITDSSIGLYESGSRQPSLYALIRLASVYNVTTDYLLGCDSKDKKNYISLEGLSEKQIDAINQIVDCFRS